MAFCKNCGQQLADDAVFCANCGAQQTPQAQQNNAQAQQNYAQQAPVQPQVMNADGSPLPSEKGVAWLSYVGLLFLVPMFARKNSEYCRFHVKQGATICAVEIAYAIVKAIIMAIINAIFPGYTYWGITVHSGVYNAFDIIFSLAYIFIAVISIIGIVSAATGNKRELPLVSKIPWIANLLDKTVYKS